MRVDELTASIHEDLNAQITAIWFGEDAICLKLECDDWRDEGRRRCFELRCRNVRDFNLGIGSIAYIDFVADHPVLFEYQGEQGNLFFSSAPESPAEVFFAVHDFVSESFASWIEPSRLLNGSPQQIAAHLSEGYGLLARGPVSILESLAGRLRQYLHVNVVPSYVPKEAFQALIVDDRWLICKSIDLIECSPAWPLSTPCIADD